LLPPSGYISFLSNPIEFIKLMLLPTLALGPKYAAVIYRQIKSALEEVLRTDFIRTARSKGLSEKQVVMKHALKNSIIPILTIIGMQFGRLLGGAVIVEKIFRIPGMGRLAVDSILYRDFEMMQGIMIVIAFMIMIANFFVDVVYVYFNPRIRYN
jgi:peptide/nickel transport system permease protein